MMNNDADNFYLSNTDSLYAGEKLNWFSMRELAQTLKGMCIQEMHFHIGMTDFHLTDPPLCALFLEALKNVTPPPEAFGNQMDSVEIIYTDSDNVMSYASLSFSAVSAPGSIGESFCDALLQLGKFLARSIREFVAENAADIVEIEIFGMHISLRDEVSRIISILKQIDETAFAFTKVSGEGFYITLHRRNNPPKILKMKVDMDISNDLSNLIEMYGAQYKAQKKIEGRPSP